VEVYCYFHNINNGFDLKKTKIKGEKAKKGRTHCLPSF